MSTNRNTNSFQPENPPKKLSKFSCGLIDQTMGHLFTPFYQLPIQDALSALRALATLPMMDQNAQAYPPMPALFHAPLYSAEEMQESLTQLCKIMRNRNPQKQTKYDDDLSSEVNHGMFGLKEDGISVEDVRDYLKHRLTLEQFTLVAFQEAAHIMTQWKNNPEKKAIYYKNFSRWVKQSSGESMPEAMKKIILDEDENKNPFKDNVIRALQNNGLRMEEKSAAGYSISFDNILENIFNLAPNVFDDEMASCLHTFFSGWNLKGKELKILKEYDLVLMSTLPDNKKNKAKAGKIYLSDTGKYIVHNFKGIIHEGQIDTNLVNMNNLDQKLNQSDFKSAILQQTSKAGHTLFDQDLYCTVQKTLITKIEEGDPSFVHAREVSMAFIKVAEAKEALNLYGVFIQLNDNELVNAVSQICEDYVNHLHERQAHEHMPLEDEKNNRLNAFFNAVSEFLVEKAFHDWVAIFFASYFKGNASEQKKLLTQFFYFALDQKKLCVTDTWLGQLLQQNINREDGVVDITDYHLNRIVMHALCTPIGNWSDLFFDIFTRALNLPTFVQRHAYPPEFCTQLRWLCDAYINRQNDMMTPAQPDTTFPMLCYPGNIGRLTDTLKALSPEQILAIFEIKNTSLLSFINTAQDFSNVISNLNPDQRTAVYESVKAQLPSIIKTAPDFTVVLLYLKPDQRTAVYESVKEKLPSIIETARDFVNVLLYLKPDQITAVYESVKEKLPSIIHTTQDLKNVIYNLNLDQATAVCESESGKARLLSAIKTAQDIIDVLDNLNLDQATAVCESVKTQLQSIIKTAQKFNFVLWYLKPKQITAVCGSIKTQLSSIINTAQDFNNVLHCLGPDQTRAVCEGVKAQLPSIIKTAPDFTVVLLYLRPYQRTTVYESVKTHLPSIIHTAQDFKVVLSFLNPGQRTAVYEDVKKRLPSIIHTAQDFIDVICDLNLDQTTAVYESVEAKLPSIIHTAQDFFNVISNLNPDQRTAVYESVKAQLPSTIHTAQDFNNVIRNLNPDQITAVCGSESVKEQLPLIISTAKDFIDVIYALKPDQKTAVYESVKTLLLSIIETQQDICGVTEYCDLKQEVEIYEKIASLRQSIDKVNNYIENRKKMDEEFPVGFFKNLATLDCKIKISAAKKYIKYLKKETTEFTSLELNALLDSRLGDIVRENQGHFEELNALRKVSKNNARIDEFYTAGRMGAIGRR